MISQGDSTPIVIPIASHIIVVVIVQHSGSRVPVLFT